MKQSKRKGKQVAVTLIGKPLEHFELFKTVTGFSTDAEAARVLMTQRLAQLKRNGALAKAA